MRYLIIVLALLLAPVVPAQAEIGVSIGINLGVFPALVPVPGYPVYYDPGLDGNYFFYDGLYWVYEGDRWYSSNWYNGPWRFVGPEFVPLFILRIPVRYYHRPPPYFRGWRGDEPPRWGEHWGRAWEGRRAGWDHWDRRSAPRPAPLPLYQRQYSGDRYPRAVEQQRSIHAQNYHYQPRDSFARQQYRAQERADRPPAAGQRRGPADARPGAPHRGEVAEPRRAYPPPGEQRQAPGSADRRREEATPRPREDRQPHQSPGGQPHEPRSAPPPREQGRPDRGHDARNDDHRPDHR
jgi:hypothetical protein